MEKSKVEFVYKNISSLNKISIVNKKIFRILPYICVPSLVVGGIAVFLKEMLPIKGVLPDYIRLVCLVIFFLTFLMWLVSFFFEYIFLFLWKCPVCKGKFPWYKTTLGYLGEEGWGILDSGYDLDLAIASCDCYYGDYSSVAQLFWETGKPVLYQDSLVREKECKIPCWPGAFWEDEKEVWFVHGKVNLLFHYDKQMDRLSCIGKIPGELAFKGDLFRSVVRVEDRLYLVPYFARNLAIYHIDKDQFESVQIRDAEHFIEQPLFLKGFQRGNVLYCMPAWYNSILCIDLTSGHVTYTMVDKNKVRGIPGVFGGAVSIGRNILCPQTYKKRWLILNTDTGKVSWCSFADPEREITSVTVGGDTLVFFDARTGCILKETREEGKIEELLYIDSNEIQLYAVSENEVIADDLGSGTYLKFCLDGTVVWRKERKEEKTVLGSRFRKVTEGEKNCDIRFTEQEYQEWNSPSAAIYKDILPTDLYYVEEENEVLTLDKWLSLCDRIHMPVPDDRHSGEMIKDYVKSKLANG